MYETNPAFRRLKEGVLEATPVIEEKRGAWGRSWEWLKHTFIDMLLPSARAEHERLQVSSNDISQTLITEASARHITQLVLGLPARSRWEELLSGSVINRVLRLTQEMRVHLVTYKKE